MDATPICGEWLAKLNMVVRQEEQFIAQYGYRPMYLLLPMVLRPAYGAAVQINGLDVIYSPSISAEEIGLGVR